MYKYPSKQVSVTDFEMPMGMSLDQENRWVKKSRMIPWEAIERRYAKLFESGKGNPAKPLRMALGALLIQKERGISDVEVALQIQETPCLQYFCGLPGYVNELPFDASSMVHFRKRLTENIFGEINEMVIAGAQKPEKPVAGDDDNEPPNSGTLIVDATCAPQNIRYPQDTSLLNEAREKLEAMVDKLHKPGEEKPRTYRQKARKDYLNFAKGRKKTGKQIRKAQGQQLRYIRRDMEIVEEYLRAGRELPRAWAERLETIKTLYEQQLSMFQNRTHRVDDRIVSLHQPWVRPIVRGKAKAKCEFGAKLDISVADGFVRLEHTSFDAYNESENLIPIIKRYHERTGRYPHRVLADGIYRNRENINWCNEKGIRLMGKPLGRPPKNFVLNRKLCRADAVDRIQVERKFSYAKGSFGLGLIRTRLKETSLSAIALSVLALNIAHLARLSFVLFRLLILRSCCFYPRRGLVIVQ